MHEDITWITDQAYRYGVLGLNCIFGEKRVYNELAMHMGDS